MNTKLHNRVDVAIGSKVRRLRQRSGLTGTDMAARLKIGPEDLIQFEHGTRRIGSTLLDEMATIFGVPVWSFFDCTSDDVAADDCDVAPVVREQVTLH